ncbi:MAG TPA: hypothetical protein VD907_06630 [Verrucomicrobiae bacterium]|nr:hypothetical protein [Verrucomicrobiae bacterium]
MKVVTIKGFRDYSWGNTFRYPGDEFEVDAIRGNALKKAGFVNILPASEPLIKEEKEETVTKEYKPKRKTKKA